MGSLKELFEKVQSDEEFAKEFSEALQAGRDAGAKDVYENFIPVAAKYGYEVSREELETTMAQQSEEMTEEELGKVAGGTSCWLVVASAFFSVMGATVVATIVTAATEDD